MRVAVDPVAVARARLDIVEAADPVAIGIAGERRFIAMAKDLT